MDEIEFRKAINTVIEDRYGSYFDNHMKEKKGIVDEFVRNIGTLYTIVKQSIDFNLILDTYYSSAFDFFGDNEDMLVKMAKLHKDELHGFDLEDDISLINELIDIYGSDSDVLIDWLELEYNNTNGYFSLIDYNEREGDFHVRVWKCTLI